MTSINQPKLPIYLFAKADPMKIPPTDKADWVNWISIATVANICPMLEGLGLGALAVL